MPRARAGSARGAATRRTGATSRDLSAETDAAPAGPRPFWSGQIVFGLVNLPVGLYVAQRSSHVALRIVGQDGTPLARRFVCSAEERLLDDDEIARAYEVEPDRFVLVEDEELEAVAPEKSQEIDLRRFVALEEIDPILFERAYVLAPERGTSKAYRLLARTMEESGRAGIATFVMRGKEYLVAIVAEGGLLHAQTLRFHDELRTPESIGLPELEPADAARRRTIEKAIARLGSETLDRDALADRHAQRLRALAERKLRKGVDVVLLPEDVEVGPDEGGEIIDLMAVLAKSLAQRADERAAEGARRTRPRGAAPARARAAHAARKPAGTARGGGRPRSGTAPRSSLAARSKKELYARAQALGIEGRSAMSKDELIAALRAAG